MSEPKVKTGKSTPSITKVATSAQKKVAVQRHLVFSLGQEEYAIPLLKVKEVIAVPEITPVPFMPDHFLGITNLRGQIVSVLDLRKKFGMKTTDFGSETALIVVDLNQTFLGVIVDSVNRVLALTEADISKPPAMLDVALGVYLNGVVQRNDKIVLLIEIAKTLNVDEAAALTKLSTEEAS